MLARRESGGESRGGNRRGGVKRQRHCARREVAHTRRPMLPLLPCYHCGLVPSRAPGFRCARRCALGGRWGVGGGRRVAAACWRRPALEGLACALCTKIVRTSVVGRFCTAPVAPPCPGTIVCLRLCILNKNNAMSVPEVACKKKRVEEKDGGGKENDSDAVELPAGRSPIIIRGSPEACAQCCARPRAAGPP